jgi:predicted MFS family arabinose efflux permease
VALILLAVPAGSAASRTGRRVDAVGGGLCACGLGGIVFGLIEQPRLGWSSAVVVGPMVGGAVLLAGFVLYERRARDPMLPLRLFRRRNFAAGNVETLAMYAGLAILFFFLTLFLQQVGGYTPLQSGLATLPTTAIMFFLSRRFGALSDHFGPRIFMGAGPLVCAAGLLLFQRVGIPVDYAGAVLPALLVFALGLAMTVAPLTAAVLADATESDAGIASAVNNAVARVAGLLGTAGIGAVVAASFSSRLSRSLAGTSLGAPARAVVAQARRLPLGLPGVRGLPPGQGHAIRRAAEQASLHSFRVGMMASAALLAVGGAVGFAGIRNRRGRVPAEECPGGQLLGDRQRMREPTAPAGEVGASIAGPVDA